MNRMLIMVRQRGQFSVASEDSLFCPSVGTSFISSVSDTTRLHSGHFRPPLASSARVPCRSAKPIFFFRPMQAIVAQVRSDGDDDLPARVSGAHIGVCGTRLAHGETPVDGGAQ